jgi:hypothetical protein
MVPAEQDRKRLPTMSWESVVDAPVVSTAEPARPPAAVDLAAPAVTTPEPSTSGGDDTIGSIVLAPLALNLDPAPAPESPAPVSPAAESPAAESQETFLLPPIVEATPVAEVPTSWYEDSGTPDVAPVPIPADVTNVVPVIASVTVVEAAPIAVAAPAPVGPRLPEVSLVVTPPVAEAARQPAPLVPSSAPRRQPRRWPKRLFILLLLAGLVAAAVLLGRPYLFPGEFDEATAPYAQAVEAARGVEFDEPIAVISESTAEFGVRTVAELSGDWEREVPLWRALGLLNGRTGPSEVARILEGWQSALYSTADGQVYVDELASGPTTDAAITLAMAAASLDQEFRWSPGQPGRGLDGEVETLAEVTRQSREVLGASRFAVELDPVKPAVLVFVPPVPAYRALAPVVFAEFDRTGVDATNTLESMGPGGPGPLRSAASVVAPAAERVEGDLVVGSPQAMDRAFWYLVFAGYLDPVTAFAASESVVESAVTIVDRNGTACVYSTFAGGDLSQTATLREAVERWAFSVPAGLTPAVSVLPDGTLQLVTCDPGEGAEVGSRQGVARELVAWRTAELATYEFLIDRAEDPAASVDLAPAWAVVAASSVPLDLAALPADLPPSDIAAAARTAVAGVLAPAG